jgi:SAM-dependent methyltransferase
VAAARRAGYDSLGLEPSNRGVWAARDLGVPLIQSTISAADLGEDSLDVITLWHVLEHLDDPSESLGRLASWLRPGGALLVGVPNLGSWQARVCPARWYHLDVPRHRVHYTVAGLETLLGRHGFEPVRTSQLFLEHNPFGMWQSLMSRLTRQPSYLYNLLKHNAPARSTDLLVSLAGLLLAPPAALVELVAGLSGHGGTVAVLAKRAEYD